MLTINHVVVITITVKKAVELRKRLYGFYISFIYFGFNYTYYNENSVIVCVIMFLLVITLVAVGPHPPFIPFTIQTFISCI